MNDMEKRSYTITEDERSLFNKLSSNKDLPRVHCTLRIRPERMYILIMEGDDDEMDIYVELLELMGLVLHR